MWYSLDNQSRLLSFRLGLALVRWQGVYEDIETTWLRWITLEGDLLPTSQEMLALEKEKAEAGARRAKAAEAEVARLKALLMNKDNPS